MKLTREQAIAEHRKMWNWLADETLKRKTAIPKKEYFIANSITHIPLNQCYCCEYVGIFEIPIGGTKCHLCPIDWKRGNCLNSEYGKWEIAYSNKNYKLASKCASIIAKLPAKEF